MKENLIEPERVSEIQESLYGFLMDEVIDPPVNFMPIIG
jgi:hypothetical protein